MSQPVTMEFLSCIPYDPTVFSYVNWGQLVPYTYTNWREETLSWKESCYISTFLSNFGTVRVSGPDFLKLLSKISINGFEKFPVGSAKHMVWTTEKGNVLEHGLIMRTGEDEATSYIIPFYMMYQAEKLGLNVTLEPCEPEQRAWTFQLAGPKSLQIVEETIEEDIHDLRFMHFVNKKSEGYDVRVIRMGMGGSLSYEIQGNSDEAGLAVYAKIMQVGEKYGIKRLGVNQYMSNHTENGFPQNGLHFPPAALDDPGYIEYMKAIEYYMDDAGAVANGSWSDDIHDYYRNPIELGWGFMIDWNHDFIGKEALEQIRDNGPREMVTLEWNHEDMIKVFASFFEKGEAPYEEMPFPQDFGRMGAGENIYLQNKVLKDGKVVGVSMWRTYTLYYRETISLCCIDAELAKEGTEVTLVWGDNGKRQCEIRAKVARYPYLDLVRNKNFDIESIPHFSK